MPAVGWGGELRPLFSLRNKDFGAERAEGKKQRPDSQAGPPIDASLRSGRKRTRAGGGEGGDDPGRPRGSQRGPFAKGQAGAGE